MASAIGAPLVSIPVVGWVAGLALSYVDARFILPGLFPSKNKTFNPDKLLDVPTGAQGQGSPAVTAFGRRVRIPAHVMWQSRKTRESNPSSKSGSGIIQRQVFVDCMLALNTRRSVRLVQLYGNGRLIAWNDRNLVGVTTPGMSLSYASGSGGLVTITMDTTAEVSFANTFRIGFRHDSGTTTSAVTSGANTLADTSKTWAGDEHRGRMLRILDASQPNGNILEERMIRSNTSTTIQTLGNWSASHLSGVHYEIVTAPDLVTLSGFTPSNPAHATVLNGTVFRVVKATAHGFPATSTLVLQAIDGQTFSAGGTATAGTDDLPASVTRLDDAFDLYDMAGRGLAGELAYVIPTLPGGTPSEPWLMQVRVLNTHFAHFQQRLNVGDKVTFTPNVPPRQMAGVVWTFRGGYYAYGTDHFVLEFTSATNPAALSNSDWPWDPWNNGASARRLLMRMSGSQKVASGFFPPDYDPNVHFQNGAETQGEHPLLVETYGSGNSSAHRGVCIQGLSDFNVTQIGGQLPFSLDAILECDVGLSLAGAVSLMLQMGGLRPDQIDVTDVPPRPFEGSAIRGSIAMKQAIQPILAAYRLLVQERAGKLCVFSVDRSEVVDVRNTPTGYSDVGWSADRTVSSDRLQFEHPPVETLPTNVGVRFQDPDLAYTEGYEPFALRAPSGVDHENVQDLSMLNTALRRRDARDLATSTLRLAWINSTRFRTTLPNSFLHLLENDILRVPDDIGNTVVGRIIQRDIGTDWLVNVVCVVEEPTIQVTNSAVQSFAGEPPPRFPPPAELESVVLDAPAPTPALLTGPALLLACCATRGGVWGGASVYESLDDETWTLVGTLSVQSVVGEIVNADMASASPSEDPDSDVLTQDTASFDVQFDHDGAGIMSSTLAGNMAGENWFAVVDADDGSVEVIAVETVVSAGNGAYTFSKTLRGIRGTKAACLVDHPVGSKVVLLTGLDRLMLVRQFPGTMQPTTLFYRFVPAGGSLDSTDSIEVDATWRNVRPFPLKKLTKTIGASPYDVTLVAENWTRELIVPGQLGPHPVDDLPETYKFRLYGPGGSSLEVERTVTAALSGSSALRDPECTFTAAELTAAGYTPGPSLVVVVDCVQVGAHGDGESVKQAL